MTGPMTGPLWLLPVCVLGLILARLVARAALRLPAEIEADRTLRQSLPALWPGASPAERRSPLFYALQGIAIALPVLLTELGWAPADTVFCSLAAILLAALIAVDAKHFLLPDLLVAALALGGLFRLWPGGWTAPAPLDAGIGMIAGAGGLWLIRYLFRLWRGVDGLGLGDIKLVAALALWLGWQGLPALIFLGAVATLLYGTGLALLSGQGLRRDTALPLGVGLCAAAWLVLAGQIAGWAVVSPIP